VTTPEIIAHLEPLGTASTRKVLLNHDAREPIFGVKIADLKALKKRIKKDHQLALELFETGIYDAQYLAGLIADETKMTRANLERWLAKSNSRPIAGTAVAWVAAESPHGWDLAREWIDSGDETRAETGWAALTSLVAVRKDSELDEGELGRLLQRVERTIHQQPNHVRYAMNGFVIALGSYVSGLTERALEAGKSIGPVSVNMGNTACQVPSAPDYIRKVQARGAIGRKRKSARC
jgi:3-methyladenine DNA glycosylase AlkD